jgi:hypothetical protein
MSFLRFPTLPHTPTLDCGDFEMTHGSYETTWPTRRGRNRRRDSQTVSIILLISIRMRNGRGQKYQFSFAAKLFPQKKIIILVSFRVRDDERVGMRPRTTYATLLALNSKLRENLSSLISGSHRSGYRFFRPWLCIAVPSGGNLNYTQPVR